MKDLLLASAANGWVLGAADVDGNTYAGNSGTHVFGTMGDLQEAIPTLLRDECIEPVATAGVDEGPGYASVPTALRGVTDKPLGR
jgi:hypothetical protein